MSQEYSEQIRLKGLPFMLQGWNTVYYKTNDERDGCPVYRLNPYVLYLFFSIIGIRIFRQNGQWVMQRDCDFVIK